MKIKYWGIILLATLLFYSCSDNDLPKVDGMWQLKSVESATGTQKVDTIYYSFTHKAVFAYTLLRQSAKPESSSVLHGYVLFPDDKTMSLEMDAKHDNLNFDLYPRIEKTRTYGILHLSSKKMTLTHDDETYHFVKF
ncbi:hypothetical protein M2459_002048 [Parabacteroides sp. PF5-5]|uniref:lipocalin-like domain-containing protein n=1 Tax=unclassified Parabacteroides TaxID=2649774 RepID=UPI002474AE96|nr:MULTISPECIES: lipocalin-like domain-containing protein [unclassified Parabacteroides]MDH6316381.1 hypothetical protein [Parabacteroides sp. PF5-13]MDH6327568.1 hypothetical protein [Parabacteroides sp. PH5-41]MDH6335292.1 hypothetical protein [Parabacteroides sp. PF5-5]MDH6346355.1 hypothetical protein [Parabacteroides sp. PH5-46]MDH6361394.1 hypothetical protein [Parabacteroides sp. PH5-16]